ncbi:MAG: adenosine deaminase [Hamadaea sp.]|nr:adenosine deaminase [Hamadaea sp.]NUT02397.1 adenosine deaminase [Hamadaea sp.]
MGDLRRLPKANLHLHLTGAMRPATLAELATRAGLPLPPPLPGDVAHGWEAFQERYDIARSAVRTAADVTRVIRETIADSEDDGAAWVEIQIDPTSYAQRLGGEAAVVETALAAAAGRAGIVLASSWAGSPETAARIARLAALYRPHGVLGFGLSNDERRGRVADFAEAFRIAADAGLLSVPHAGFYEAAWHVRDCVDLLGARRIGHGLTAAADPVTLEFLAERGVTLEVCPTSYPPFGMSLPLARLLEAGVPVALGTDDPLLFGADLSTQYAIARRLGLDDAALAELARQSIHASAAPPALRASMLAGVDAWLRS